MSGLPHHRLPACLLDSFGKRLRCLDVENDGLPFPGALQCVPRVHDEQIVSPDNFAGVVDDSDPVGVSVECDPDLGPVLLYGRDEVFDILRNGRIRMVVGESAVAFAE
jgi:hypothetical protein